MANNAPDLTVGQMVVDTARLWTPDGWVPRRLLARVVDPCVQHDPDYAGYVQIDYVTADYLGPHFVPRHCLHPASDAEVEAANIASSGPADG